MADARPFDPESILRVLAQRDVAYVLIDGLAASLHGSPHVTTNVDITPDVDPRNLARLADPSPEIPCVVWNLVAARDFGFARDSRSSI